MLEIAINWFKNLVGRVTYSMISRLGPGSYDCSSSIYIALKSAGLLPANTPIGNTDSLFRHLETNGWVRLPEASNGFINSQRGDVFIWGKRGASGGAFGHTGQFVDANNIIHCSSGYNGIHVDNHDWLWALNGRPEVTIYRYIGSAQPAGEVGDPNDQSIDVGSWIRFTGVYAVNAVEEIGGIWQVKSDALAPKDFTWDDNGVPAEPIFEVDSEGYATADQSLAPGSLFKIPGKYQILDYGQTNGVWWGLISWNGLKFWIDLAQATEVPSTDSGTPMPSQRPVVPPVEPPKQPDPPTAPEPPKPIEPPAHEPPVEPPKIDPPTPPIEKPNENNKENEMAFSEKEQKQLKSATQSAQEFANEIAASEEVQELVKGISRKTKLIVYFVGDTFVGLGLIVPMLAIVLGWEDLQRIVALSGIFSTSGGFLLMMFGIYKGSKKS